MDSEPVSDFTVLTKYIVLSTFFYSPPDAQVNCLKNNFKSYIKINIKTAPTCFGAVALSAGSVLLVLGKASRERIAGAW